MILFGIVISIISAWLCSCLSPEFHRKLLVALSVFFVGSEIGKQILLFVWNGYNYIWWYFPFQLCSMPLYLLPTALILDESSHSRVRRAFFTFMADFGTLAGIFVFVDTSGMHYQLPILTVHSYLWHFLMIFTGVFLALSQEYRSSFPRFGDACAVFLSGAAIAAGVNALFHACGSINMFYISPWEPVTQAVFRDIASFTGGGICHIIYLAVIIVGAGIIHICFGMIYRKS